MTKQLIIGVDEVGRGCLAGALTVAAVSAPANSKFRMQNSKLLKGIKDSKKLSAIQREEWDRKFKNRNSKIKIAVASVGPQIVDRVGISYAARLAVGRCLKKLKVKNQKPKLQTTNYKILLDGSLYAPRTYENQKTIIKGDEKVPLIAAASIIAKVHRDKTMTRLSKKFPEYGLDVHKGYGTKAHIRAIKKHGLSELHRRSFCAKIS